MLRDDEYTAAQAYEKVIRGTFDVMGPEWMPQGEWGDWIQRLLDEQALLH